MESKVPEKKERLLTALDQGMVMIHLDARRPGVSVPSHLGGEAHLRLNLSYRFEPPDLTVNEWGVRSTLSFSGSRFTVAVPWNALFAITSHVSREFWLYPEDMPQELLQHPLASPPAVRDAAAPPPPGPRPRAMLREVACERGEDGPAPTVAPHPKAEPLPAPQPVSAAPQSPPSAAPASPGSPPDEPPPPAGPRRSHLRIVK